MVAAALQSTPRQPFDPEAAEAALGKPWKDLPAAPQWAPYNPNGSSAQRAAMYMGLTADPAPFMNTTADIVRPECEHWKPYLGW